MELIGVVVLLVWGSAAAAAQWFSDVIQHARDLAQGSPEDAIAATNRAYAIGDALVIAVLADGELDARERASLAMVAAAHELDVDEFIGRWSARAAELAAPGGLERALQGLRGRLSDEDRALVVERVKQLAAAGSGRPAEVGYREMRRSDPAALVDAYERAFLRGADASGA
jgi:hypothetical protein